VAARRFPPPWSAEETDACFIVRDANGQALAYVYFEEAPGRRAAAKLLTHDEARRIAASAAEAARVVGPPSNSGSETNIWAGDARCDKIDRGLHG
jgi:hypothetical protein